MKWFGLDIFIGSGINVEWELLRKRAVFYVILAVK
jgi:hypothetical protein